MTEREMKDLTKRHGNSYFDKKTVEFWNSKIEKTADNNGIFVESVDDFDRENRLYLVKAISMQGEIQTIEPDGTMYTFKSPEEAKSFAKELSDMLGKGFGLPKEVKENLKTKGEYTFVNAKNEELTINTSEIGTSNNKLFKDEKKPVERD
jgi:hypothetical protein